VPLIKKRAWGQTHTQPKVTVAVERGNRCKDMKKHQPLSNQGGRFVCFAVKMPVGLFLLVLVVWLVFACFGCLAFSWL